MDVTRYGAVFTPRRSHTPGHLWLVGVLAVLWNMVGVVDYTLTNIGVESYLDQFPPEALEMIEAMPVWAHIGWALGVWGAMAGSVLLLLRSRRAVLAFAISLAGLAAGTLSQWLTPLPDVMRTHNAAMMNLTIWAAAIALLVYAWWMARRHVLA